MLKFVLKYVEPTPASPEAAQHHRLNVILPPTNRAHPSPLPPSRHLASLSVPSGVYHALDYKHMHSARTRTVRVERRSARAQSASSLDGRTSDATTQDE